MFSYKRYLNHKTFREKNKNHILDFLPKNRCFSFISSARGGIEAFIDMSGIKKNDSVLIPAFVPEGLSTPFKKKGINMRIYKSRSDLSINYKDLEYKLKSDNTIKAVFIIHYFGFPQDTKKISKLCRKYRVFLIEDCAQALFSKDNEGNILGSIGDVSIYSLPKSIPVPDGGLILFNNTNLVSLNHRSLRYNRSVSHLFSVIFHLIYLLIKNFEIKMEYSFLYRVFNFATKIFYFLYYQLLRIMPKPARMSNISSKILKKIDYKQLIKRRRINAEYFYTHIDKKKYKLVFPDHNKNYILTGIPILSDNRDRIIKCLRKKGIDCLKYEKCWDVISNNNYGDETNFSRNHFLVPISENISESDMEYIVYTMNKLCLETNRKN
ncbi:MAG: DegT/DnrJ/EryC1/StrS aminotransferase family protein [Candidatus Aminicenantes bacterium]|nr:MAG: DegT/DnrJ/EryC1/StrS aminotransferase family protein [Candidatus Aminicenantes bacterium]